MKPLLAFQAAVLLTECWQWLIWMTKHKEQGVAGYWKQGWTSLALNQVVNVAVACLWAYGMLDPLLQKAASFLPGDPAWANVGIPFTPETGIVVGALSDLFGDDAALLIQRQILDRIRKATPPDEGGK